MLNDLNLTITQLMGNDKSIQLIDLNRYVSDLVGLPTLKDIVNEIKKPGRDPRPEFKMAQFKDGVENLKDLYEGLILEGVITNVTNFGAFVDIGVHQDGLVHISQLGNKFISDPNQVVSVGQIVKVKVLEVDMIRKRIQLSMRLNETVKEKEVKKPKHNIKFDRKANGNKNLKNNAFEIAFNKALENKS